MVASKVISNKTYHIGTGSDSIVATAPASLYHEQTHSFVPPAFTPSTGTIARCDVHHSTSTRGLISDLDLVFDINNGSATDTMHVHNFVSLFQFLKVYIDNIEVYDSQDTDVCALSMTRNLAIMSKDYNEYKEKWMSCGVVSGDGGYLSGYASSQNISLAPSTGGRVSIPLNLLLGGVMDKFDTGVCNKITVEIRFRPNSGVASDIGSFISNATANTNIYPSLTVTNAHIEQRVQLYSDDKLLKDSKTPHVFPLIKHEKQSFTLSKSIATATTASPATLRVRLSDSFSFRKRIIGLQMSLPPQYTVFNAVATGQSWQPMITKAVITKNGKELVDLQDYHKFSRQSKEFLRSLGAEFDLTCEGVKDATRIDREEVIFHGNCGNFVSFLNPHLQENRSDWQSDLRFIQGISNSQNDSWELELSIAEAPVITAGGVVVPFADAIDLHLLYVELLSVKKCPQRGVEVKVFS